MAAGGKKPSRIIIYIVLIVILAFVLVFILVSRNKGTATQQTTNQATQVPVGDMVNIVVTTQSIAQGVVITQDVLTTIPYPRKDLVEGTFFTDMTAVVGKRARYNLDARIPLTSSMVVDVPTASMASFLIPQGMTAYSIPITNDNSVSFAPQVGDHIMIIGCLSLVRLDQSFQTRLPNWTSTILLPGPDPKGGPSTAVMDILTAGAGAVQGRVDIDPNLNQPLYVVPSEAQRPSYSCNTVISDAVVLKVGEFSQTEATAPASGATSTSSTTGTTAGEVVAAPVTPDHITIIVSPQDAVTLTYLRQVGVPLTLALRSAGDLQSINTSSVTMQYVMDQKNIQLPAQLPYGIYPTARDLQLESLSTH
jgi:Flp pilus assembly protein CpaB